MTRTTQQQQATQCVEPAGSDVQMSMADYGSNQANASEAQEGQVCTPVLDAAGAQMSMAQPADHEASAAKRDAERAQAARELYAQAAVMIATTLRLANPPLSLQYGPVLDAWAGTAGNTDIGAHCKLLATASRAINPPAAVGYGAATDGWAAAWTGKPDPLTALPKHLTLLAQVARAFNPPSALAYGPAMDTIASTIAAKAKAMGARIAAANP